MEDSLDCSVSVTTEHHCSLSFKGCLCFCKFGVDVPLGGGGDLWCGRLQVTLCYIPTRDSFWVSYHCSHIQAMLFFLPVPWKSLPQPLAINGVTLPPLWLHYPSSQLSELRMLHVGSSTCPHLPRKTDHPASHKPTETQFTLKLFKK